ncbi:MAG: hypothetical protein EFT35_06865 [Methanophagales archaeon ANME-1-THS]|nr:MAG: hypothetical protein EFT35_06865 [Methanophagales archaeon ANME-1-THS]
MKIERRIVIEIVVILLAIKIFAFTLTLLVGLGLHQPGDIISRWNRWDAPHYVEIAKNGYTNVREASYLIVFMPLFPLVIRLLTALSGNYEISALLISNSASLLAGIFLYKLARIDYAHSTALKSLLYFALFPTSYFLIAGYTEGLFLCLTISCFYYARQEKWLPAGLLGMFASATRITGLVLIPSVLYEYFSAESKSKSRSIKDIVFICMISFGFLSYLIVNSIVFGNAFMFLELQREHWSKYLAPPWEGLLSALWIILWHDPVEKVLVGGAEIIFSVFGLACIIYASFTKFRFSYTIYMILTWLTVASTRFWLSMPRYTLSIFPIFTILALVSDKREELHYLLMMTFLFLFSILLVLFTQGYWAF